jgi:signal recognition particle subunit SRP54
MVLEKLGSALRKAMNSIASAVFIDKTKVNEITKELQRALLEADVDVKLVFEISEKIKIRIEN